MARHKLTFVENPKFTTKYTKVWCESKEDQRYGCPHNFFISINDDNYDEKDITYLAEVHFQEGPIKEVGINGVCNEDLILMILTRLEAFQKGPYRCAENITAINHLYGAIEALRARTNRREANHTEGTSKPN